MKESKEAMKLALEFVEYHSKYWNGEGQHPQEIATALREALAEQPTAWVTAGQHTVPLVTQPAQQEQGDSICQEDDGCPTELAVLQRFWRGQSIPYEHYPAWFKPAQQEPAAWQNTAKHMEIVSAEDWENIDPMWHWMYRPLYPSPSAQQKAVAWQVMVEDEAIKEFSIKDTAHDWCVQQKLSGSPYAYWIRPLYPSPSQREPLLREIAALSANALDDYKMIQKLMAERQPLTDDEISSLWDGHTVPVFGKTGINPIVFARAIEAAHGIKENT